MSIYNFPRLYDNTNQSPTTNYYSGLNRPNPVGNSLGNRTTSTNTGNPINTSGLPNSGLPNRNLSGGVPQNQYVMNTAGDVRYNRQTGMPEFKNQDGSWTPATNEQTGPGSRRDPRMYGNSGGSIRFNYGMGQSNNLDKYYGTESVWDDNAGGMVTRNSWNLKPEWEQRLNGRQQIEQGGLGGYNEVIDPNADVEWDDEFGFVTKKNNIGADDQFNTNAANLVRLASVGIPIAMMGGYVPGIEGAFGAAPAAGSIPGAVGDAEQILASESLLGPTTTPYNPITAPPGLDLTGPPGPYSGEPFTGPPTGPPPMPTSGPPPVDIPPTMPNMPPPPSLPDMSTYTPSSSNGFPFRDAFRLGSSIYGAQANRGLSDQYRTDINNAANRADPVGQANRDRANARLWELYDDPSSIENTPGYRFAREQGEQGVQRAAAGKGYFRSPNMLYNLSKFNQGLAQQTYEKEINRLLQMAGYNWNPTGAGTILANGAQGNYNAGANRYSSYIDAGDSAWRLLFGSGGDNPSRGIVDVVSGWFGGN